MKCMLNVNRSFVSHLSHLMIPLARMKALMAADLTCKSHAVSCPSATLPTGVDFGFDLGSNHRSPRRHLTICVAAVKSRLWQLVSPCITARRQCISTFQGVLSGRSASLHKLTSQLDFAPATKGGANYGMQAE